MEKYYSQLVVSTPLKNKWCETTSHTCVCPMICWSNPPLPFQALKPRWQPLQCPKSLCDTSGGLMPRPWQRKPFALRRWICAHTRRERDIYIYDDIYIYTLMNMWSKWYIYILYSYINWNNWHHHFVINNVLCVINNYMSVCLSIYLPTYLSTYLLIYTFCITLQRKFPMILLLHMDVTWWWCWWQWWCSVVVFFCVEVWRKRRKRWGGSVGVGGDDFVFVTSTNQENARGQVIACAFLYLKIKVTWHRPLVFNTQGFDLTQSPSVLNALVFSKWPKRSQQITRLLCGYFGVTSKLVHPSSPIFTYHLHCVGIPVFQDLVWRKLQEMRIFGRHNLIYNIYICMMCMMCVYIYMYISQESPQCEAVCTKIRHWKSVGVSNPSDSFGIGGAFIFPTNPNWWCQPRWNAAPSIHQWSAQRRFHPLLPGGSGVPAAAPTFWPSPKGS